MTKRRTKQKNQDVKLIQRKILNPFSIDSFIIHNVKKESDLENDCLFENKYKPTKSTKIVGNEDAKNEIREFITKKKTGESSKNLCIIYGSSGVGKSISVNVILQEEGFEIIELNSDIYPQKKDFLEALKKILSIQNIHGSKKSGIIVENLEGTLGEGAFYNNFIEIINKNKPVFIPVFCVSCSDKLKKKYNTPTKLKIIEFSKPKKEELILFTAKILKKENKKITKEASKITIEQSKYDIRKLLHYIKLFSLSKKDTLTKENIESILGFSESDTFFNAYEVLEDVLKTKTDRKLETKINLCLLDQPLIIDLIYSNLPNIVNETLMCECLNSMSYSDTIQTAIYKDHNWELRDYLIISSCIKPMEIIKRNTILPKGYIFRKNQLNNLPWTCLRNKNTYNEVVNCCMYNIDNLDMQYAYKNIFVNNVEQEENEEQLRKNVKCLVSYGVYYTNYFKLRNIIFDKPASIKKKIKDNYEKIWKEYESTEFVEKTRKK